MKKVKNLLPDKLFGKDTLILTIWMVPVLIIIIFLIIFVVAVMPRINSIKSVYGQAKKVIVETKTVNDKRIYLSTLDQEELKSKSLLVENGVLSEKNSYLLIKIISKVVADFGFTVGDFSVSLGDLKSIDKAVAKFDYQKVPVEVAVSGPKANFLPMVAAIENSLPVLSIDNFNMTSTGDVATIKISVSAYYLPDWNQAKLESLSIADLTPNKDESDILTKIGGYKYYGASEAEIGRQKENFVPSNRVDPFY